jgi:hypothetical protein
MKARWVLYTLGSVCLSLAGFVDGGFVCGLAAMAACFITAAFALLTASVSY